MSFLARHRCSICGLHYETAQLAATCEARGVHPGFPIGLMLRLPEHPDLACAIAGNEIEGHWNRPAVWICRDNGYGDSLGKDSCRGNAEPPIEALRPEHAADPTRPPFPRLVAWLREQGIPVRWWDGECVREEGPEYA
jgi:hypothetical protein